MIKKIAYKLFDKDIFVIIYKTKLSKKDEFNLSRDNFKSHVNLSLTNQQSFEQHVRARRITDRYFDFKMF